MEMKLSTNLEFPNDIWMKIMGKMNFVTAWFCPFLELFGKKLHFEMMQNKTKDGMT